MRPIYDRLTADPDNLYSRLTRAHDELIDRKERIERLERHVYLYQNAE